MADESEKQDPTIITFRIERMVNGYVVHQSAETERSSVGYSLMIGPKPLVTSRAALVELLTAMAPEPLAKPAVSPWGSGPVEERVWR